MSLLPVLDAISGWRLAPEPPPPVASRAQAVLKLTMLDEITGLPPTVPPAASTTTVGLLARSTTGGLAGLVARPLRRWMPDFVTGTAFVTGAPLQISLAGSGFLPVVLTAPIGAEPGYPAAFVPVDLGSVALHRDPVTIAGRTVSRTRIVRAGAAVTLDGVWASLADLVNPPAPPNLVALASPLYADRDTTATVAQQDLTPAPPAEAKTLLRPANIGDASVRLSDQIGLAPGSIVALDPQDPQRAEYLAVTAIADLGAGPGFPAIVTLGFPLARPHPTGATAIRMIPAAAGPANLLSRPARSGDATLFPAAMTGLALAPAIPPIVTAVVIAGGGTTGAEYHAASLVTATSDAAGYVRLPPVHRVAQLRLRVHHSAEPNDLLRDVMLPLGVSALTLDLVFP
jgi:hypothetical protein